MEHIGIYATERKSKLVHFHFQWHVYRNILVFTSLLLDLKQSVHELCDFRFLHHTISPGLKELYPHHYLVYNMSSFSLGCKHQTVSKTGCHFCIIKIPCLCSISNDFIFLPPKLDNCHNESDIFTLHPVNVASSILL